MEKKRGKEKSELEYRKDKYWELDREYQRRDELHRKVWQNMQVELSQAKDKLKEAEITIAQYKKYIDDKDKDYEFLLDKYIFVLKKLRNNPEMIKQTDETIKFYNYMTSHDRELWPVFWFIAGVVISLILYSIF